MTIATWKHETVSLLVAEGLDSSPSLDARLLLEAATGLTQSEQIIHYDRRLSEEELSHLATLRDRRLAHQPIAYIRRTKEFWGRPFTVDERVLIPRSDTETLVETALAYARERGIERVTPIIDLCTGSGAVGITLAAELGVDVTLSDISEAALEVADVNARTLLGRPLPILQGDLLCPTTESYGMIVSNPPYLTPSWIDEVSAEVGWEPRLALDGKSEDGLSVIRLLIEQSVTRLKDKGALLVECDWRQCAEVATLLRFNSFDDIHIVRDLSGRERVVWGILHE
jgi:release factor glutamine methyltransferase